MTPDNDKTLRGFFYNHKIGVNEWNDRRDYREKYEGGGFHLGDGRSSVESMISAMYFSVKKDKKTIVHDVEDRYGTVYEKYMHKLADLFPETKECRNFVFMMSFGMGRNEDGTFSNCDCCGKDLHVLNSSPWAMCDTCNEHHKNETAKTISI